MMKSKSTLALCALSLSLASTLSATPSYAANDDKTPPVAAEIKPQAPAGGDSQGEQAAEVQTTNRMKTLEGSKSPFSGQLNITYQGSALSHPFSGDDPDSQGISPPLQVNLSGTVAIRYRYDKDTTMGLGIGVITYTPFQGPKNTSASDPYLDIAHSYDILGVHNRADFQLTMWTNSEYHDDFGYRGGLSLSNESTYVTKFGLTVGFLIEIDYNFFSGDAMFASNTATAMVRHNQLQWDLITDPFFEYVLSDKVNLRTVIGIQSYNRRDYSQDFALHQPTVYETLGVGVQILPAWFVYPFVQFYPSHMAMNSSILGLNTIINLF